MLDKKKNQLWSEEKGNVKCLKVKKISAYSDDARELQKFQ